jgi:hypothetical protein
MRFFKILFAAALFFLTLFVLPANKNGRAAGQNKGNTGAPGDELNANGTSKTCMNCHNQGPITATMGISVRDSMNQPVTSYKPGNTYKARVKINGTGASIQGYGFQMIALRNAGNTDLDGFKDVNPNNYKLANTSPNSRTYAEHDQVSPADSFLVTWQAPVAGTGAVTFYASGNAVNGTGGTGGDGAAVAVLSLPEFGTVATDAAATTSGLLRAWPNPVRDVLHLCWETTGDHTISVYAQDGTLVYQGQGRVGATALPTGDWTKGVYYIGVQGKTESRCVKVLKL